jgi:hypothetical protein
LIWKAALFHGVSPTTQEPTNPILGNSGSANAEDKAAFARFDNDDKVSGSSSTKIDTANDGNEGNEGNEDNEGN